MILEDIDWAGIEKIDYAPKLGYFLANDISARSLAVLGEGRKNKYDYWGASKSFQGFLPVSRKMWIPDKHAANSILCIDVTTTVNGVVKQSGNTSDIMCTPREMLFYIAKRYPDNLPEKGDIVLTGTPPGVALQVSAWKSWLANAFRLDRFTKLIFAILTGERSKRFLKPGDIIVVSGGILGKIETKIVGRQI